MSRTRLQELCGRMSELQRLVSRGLRTSAETVWKRVDRSFDGGWVGEEWFNKLDMSCFVCFKRFVTAGSCSRSSSSGGTRVRQGSRHQVCMPYRDAHSSFQHL